MIDEVTVAATDPLVGSVIGGVHIDRPIGSGGMGRVYEGRQIRPGRQVAVKVMRPGSVSPSRLRRFEFEAEILAHLHHPGIAMVHAAGTHAFDGEPLPFFVMELIAEGKPITRHADEGQLPLRHRLELFWAVCDAVAHGHERGVIHRDLKPGNILVGSDGKPKVIDFGIACTSGTDLPIGKLALTTTAELADRFLGTLQYMSPEQIESPRDGIDVRSDVYALGIVLYELLAGRLPHDLRDTPLLEAITVVRECEPPPLALLTNDLDPQLNTIVAKCLAKDRRFRYGDAAELSADIGRYLAGEMIMARAPGPWQAVTRLVRRHRVASSLGAGILLAGLIAATGIATFAAQADRARRQALSEARRADSEAAGARRQHYVANMHRIAGLVRSGALGSARQLYTETEKLCAGEPRLEMRILAADLDRSLRVFNGMGGALRSLRFSPDGSHCAAVAESAGVRVWRVADMRSRDASTPVVFGADEVPFNALAFSPDGRHVAAAGADHGIRIWDLTTGEEKVNLRGHESTIEAICFSNDGRLLASASWDRTARVWQWWDGADREPVVLRGHAGRVVRVEFMPPGDRLATASHDGTARIWEVATGHERVAMRGHEGLIYDMRLDPEGGRMVTGSIDTTARVWDTLTGAQQHVLAGHTGWVHSVAFSPDGRRVATASRDRSTRVWDIVSGALVSDTHHDSGVSGISFSPDGRRLIAASSDGAASVWRATHGTSPTILRGHAGAVTGITFSPDATMLATCSVDGTLRMWDSDHPGMLPALRGHTDTVRTITQSRDGRLIGTGSSDGTVRLWDAQTGGSLGVLGEQLGRPSALSFTPDGTRLAVATSGKQSRIIVWNTPDRSIHREFAEGHTFPSSAAVLSPNGRWAITRFPATAPPGAARDQGLATAALWSVDSGTLVATLTGHTDFVAAADFSRDGQRVATASYDGTIRLWDTDSGSNCGVLQGHTNWVVGITFSPDSHLLASCSFDGTARIWDATTGEPLHVLHGHAAKVRRVFFHPSGLRVATVSDDMTTKVWDVPTGALLVSCVGHAHQIRDAGFSPDGTRLVTLGSEGTARICDADTGEELAVLPHSGAVEAFSFAPDGLSLTAAARGEKDVRLWGRPASAMFVADH